MSTCNNVKNEDRIQFMTITEQFSKLFCELEECDEEEQMQKVKEMNELIEEMNNEEFKSVFTIKLFNKIRQMIEEKKMSMENTILLLKHVGYNGVLKRNLEIKIFISSLNKRFEEMIAEEEKKKEEENENLLTDLYECYFLLYGHFSSELHSMCVPYLLKVALKKVENEEAQKEVEMALLASSSIGIFNSIKKELYLNEIKEIIQHHHEHHNLTRIAYQSAWQFFIDRFFNDKSLEEVIVNELHFPRETAKELEVLTRCIDWKKKEEENEEKGRKETKEEVVLYRWLRMLEVYFRRCKLWNEEFICLFSSIVHLFRASRNRCEEIHYESICPLYEAAGSKAVKVEDLLKGKAVDAVLEEILRLTLNHFLICYCLLILKIISDRLKEEEKDEKEEAERKRMKMEMFEKLEEEGYEDVIPSLLIIHDIQNDKYECGLSHDIAGYFVNV